MTYQVLARKWRPKTFEQLVGQPQVVQALSNAVQLGRLHHAYLFTGTRGVGKTTIARILAKALNCEQGPTITPCLNCSACSAIEQGHYADLIEIDAASRTRVEDTREILDNVLYAPTQGRYKIYLIDEVHMLSMHSFNALLKTLEEPPSHVVFILATTELEKIPVTVLSRCLQFCLKPIEQAVLTQYLSEVCHGEHVTFEQPALEVVARSANGSVRDALSLLDQAISYCHSELKADAIQAMLGIADEGVYQQLLAALNKHSGEDLYALCQQLRLTSIDPYKVLEQLSEILYGLSVLQLTDLPQVVGVPDSLMAFKGAFPSEQLQLMYEISLRGMTHMQQLADSRVCFEMTLLRLLAFQPSKISSIEPVSQNQQQTGPANDQQTEIMPVDVSSVSPAQKQPTSQHIKQPPMVARPPTTHQADKEKVHTAPVEAELPSAPPVMTSVEPVVAGETGGSPNEPTKAISLNDWPLLVNALSLSGLAKTVLSHSVYQKLEGKVISLQIQSSYQAMLTEGVVSKIEQALSDYLTKSIKVDFQVTDKLQQETPAEIDHQSRQNRLQDAKSDLPNDACLTEILQQFDGEVVEKSIQLVDDKL